MNQLSALWRRAALFVALLLNAPLAGAQTWQSAAVGPSEGLSMSTAVDAAGNVYVAGVFSGTTTFGSTTLTSAGIYDLFVTKQRPDGSYEWAVRAGGTGAEDFVRLALDGAGDVVVSGIFSSPSVSFGTTTIVNSRSSTHEIFVARLSPAGVWEWATQAGGTDFDHSFGLAVDTGGNVLICGDFRSATATFGATTLTNSNTFRYNLFVAKLSPTGAWLWAVDAGGTLDDLAYALAVDPGGNAYVTGTFRSPSVAFGATTLTNGSIFPGNLFVAKLSPAGAWQWAVQSAAPDDEAGIGLAADSLGHLYLTGRFNGPTMALGATTLTNAGAGFSDGFVAQLATGNGAWQWATRFGSALDDHYSRPVLDSNGDLLITGAFGHPSADFGPVTLTNSSDTVSTTDVFVAKLSAAGTWQWAVSATGDHSDYGYDVAATRGGQVVVVGGFFSSIIAFGAATLSPPPIPVAVTGFVARLDVVTGLPRVAPAPALTLSPNPAHETVQLTGAPASTAAIVDALGRVVRTSPLASHTSNLDIKGLPPGLYTVRIGAAARRLLVE